MKPVEQTTGLQIPPAGKTSTYDRVAVLIPCYNEEVTVAKVVSEFQTALPGAKIFVYDNNSSDRTADVARHAGAIVVPSPRQGKGYVVRQMFDEIEADTYLMADGDDTYPASASPDLIAEFRKGGLDMIVGARTSTHDERSFRRFHKFGNRLVASLISRLFATRISDILSGYRVFSRTFVKSVPLMSKGFEVETEMTLQALAKGYPLREIPITYGIRPEGSYSKLNTFSDGFLVLKSIFIIFKDFKPLVFFSYLSLLLFLVTLGAGIFPILDYLRDRYVYHIPLAILATGTAILSALSFGIGVVLDTISKYHNEHFELLRRLLKK